MKVFFYRFGVGRVLSSLSLFQRGPDIAFGAKWEVHGRGIKQALS
jgi:hypothetical protein